MPDVGRRFEQHRDAEVAVSPEEAWEAIATGPGIDSWFMGRNEVQPGPGGAVRTAFGEYTPELPVTGWDPPRRFAYRSEEAPGGRFIAYEFLIEVRGSGSTVVRVVTSGFLPGDDWEDEYEAMTKGSDLYFATLVEYLSHFAGRFAVPVTAFGPPEAGWDHARTVLCRELGLTAPGTPGTGRGSSWPTGRAHRRPAPSSTSATPARSACAAATGSTGSSGASASRSSPHTTCSLPAPIRTRRGGTGSRGSAGCSPRRPHPRGPDPAAARTRP